MHPSNSNDSLTGRRGAIAAAALGLAGGTLAAQLPAARGAEPTGADTQPWRKPLRPSGAPAADAGYSPAILASGEKILTISGQGPANLDADMETQIRQTFDRIGLLLAAGGASFTNVVIIRSFWVHLLRDLPIFRKVRRDYLVEPYPASTAVGTPELAIPGLELEIEAVAIL